MTPQSLQPRPQATEELIAVATLGKEFLAQYGRRTDVENQRVKNEKEKQQDEAKQRTRDHRYVFILCILLIMIAAGIIFWKNNVQLGVLIISHLLALATGAFGGIEYGRYRGGRNES